MLIATKNGAETIGETVRQCALQADVFVISDGSTDGTAEIAEEAGATVLHLEENVGKPKALSIGFRHFEILNRYEYVAVVDDDTRLADEFMVDALKKFTPSVAIVCGQTRSDWRAEQRWNPWVAGRALAYWRYQLIVRRAQSALGVMSCIAGSNSVFRTSILEQVLHDETPYIVDDTYWVLEIQRRKLGEIVYASKAKAYVQDPTTLRDWYKQNLRWMHGTFQGIYGHKVGRKLTKFDVTYVGLILDWALYLFFWPIITVILLITASSIIQVVLMYFLGYAVWAVVGAIALRKWRLAFLFPTLIVTDWAHRANMIHAIFRTIRKPTSECRWVSPQRFATNTGESS